MVKKVLSLSLLVFLTIIVFGVQIIDGRYIKLQLPWETSMAFYYNLSQGGNTIKTMLEQKPDIPRIWVTFVIIDNYGNITSTNYVLVKPQVNISSDMFVSILKSVTNNDFQGLPPNLKLDFYEIFSFRSVDNKPVYVVETEDFLYIMDNFKIALKVYDIVREVSETYVPFVVDITDKTNVFFYPKNSSEQELFDVIKPIILSQLQTTFQVRFGY